MFYKVQKLKQLLKIVTKVTAKLLWPKYRNILFYRLPLRPTLNYTDTNNSITQYTCYFYIKTITILPSTI